VGLGDLPGGSFSSYVNAVSADGQVIVGAGSSTSLAHALKPSVGPRPAAWNRWATWRAAGSSVRLMPCLPMAKWLWDPLLNVLGHLSGGVSVDPGHRPDAFGDLLGGPTNSIAFAVSADGLVVGGRGQTGTMADPREEAFRWTAESGMVALGLASGTIQSVARAASASGDIIVGDDPARVFGRPSSGIACAECASFETF